LLHLDNWVQARNNVAQNYISEVKNSEIKLPKTRQNNTHAWHLFVIRSENRDHLKKYLYENGVETAIHYPTALPFLTCYESRKIKNSEFPIAFAYQSQILSLPMFPELTLQEQNRVIQLLNDFHD